MTYKQICELLAERGVESPEVDAAMLLEHFCGIGRARLPLEKDRELDDPALLEAVARRAERYPLQYILGEWGFFEGSFGVSEGVLIPRQDTELLVELAVELLVKGGRFIDLGCGSGCISVSTLMSRPDATGVAVDISPVARELTAKNAVRNGVGDRLSVIEGNMLASEFWDGMEAGGFDVLISNPPYIPTEEVGKLAPELAHEPRLALDGGDDGLDFYRVIIARGGRLLRQGGKMLFECGVGQTGDIIRLVEAQGYSACAHYDIERRDRAVSVSIDG